MTKIISLVNQKGGVGKTTTAINLGASLAACERRVLIVDLDPQANATSGFGFSKNEDNSMYPVLVDGLSLRSIIRQTELATLFLAPSSVDLVGAELELSSADQREFRLRTALQDVGSEYDYILVDSPPSLGLLTINALTAAHKVIVPVQCEYLSMRGLVQLQNTLSMIREELNPDVDIEGILPTLVDSRTVHAKEAIEILEENFGDRVFATRIRKTIRFAEAPVKGTSVLKYDPDGVAAKSYRELAKEVLGNGKK